MSFGPFLGYKIYNQKNYHETADKISSSFGREKMGKYAYKVQNSSVLTGELFRPHEGQTDSQAPRITQMTT